MTALTIDRLGKNQIAGLEIYVFDPIFTEDDGSGDLPFPGRLDVGAATLTVNDVEAGWKWMFDAINSADDHPRDAVLRDALTAIQHRIQRALTRNPP